MSGEAIHYTFEAAGDLAPTERVRLLGGKGAGLANMTSLGLPVPPGFTLTTSSCLRYLADGWFAELDTAIANGVAEIEARSGRILGDPSAPLLVSIRSGSPVSMPGMMDTVLNAGLTDEIADALGQQADDPHFGWDTARRFLRSYAEVVIGADETTISDAHDRCFGTIDGAGVRRFRDDLSAAGIVIPEDPAEQVHKAVAAVFRSWESDRAKLYRQIEGISDSLGTAATVQTMTFGNLGARSGTGVAFTRDPSTGAPGLVGDFLVNAQGEDVVAGTHSTQSLAELRTLWPDLADQLDHIADQLEHDLRDLADIEFTIEDGTLWILQVRAGKRSPRAALRIAVDMAEDSDFPLTRAEAVARVAEILDEPPMEPAAVDYEEAQVVATGIAASPGRAVGGICTDIDETIARSETGESVILVRKETSPADIAGMAEATGIVTMLGGLMSHAAVVARSWGKPAVVGVDAITFTDDGHIVIGDRHLASGTVVTVDGDRGALIFGEHPGERAELRHVGTLRAWRDHASSDAAASMATPDGSEAPTIDGCRRLLALRGMATAEPLAQSLGWAESVVQGFLDQLVANEDADLVAGRTRLLPKGVAIVNAHYRLEALELIPIIDPIMDDFHAVNLRFKEVVTAWQLRDDEPSEVITKDDVLAAIREEIHAPVVPIVEAVAAARPRFHHYLVRLEDALAGIADDDLELIAHPLRDSYHTVWFELHEELIRLAGRNRADETAAGRA